MLLTREIRFSLIAPDQVLGNKNLTTDQSESGDSQTGPERRNSWSSIPPIVGVAPFLSMQLSVSGEPAPGIGYLCDIKTLDKLARESIVPELVRQYQSGPGQYSQLTKSAWSIFRRELPDELAADSLRISASPFLCYFISGQSEPMILLSQQFEFSASHRLHSTHLSDEENRQIFGKCNHPNGHGHNYVVEISVGLGKGDDTSTVPDGAALVELESVVMNQVIDRFDHKYLNLDLDEFKTLNPTVENIAKTIWQMINGKLSHSRLANVRVYETPKTWADCQGDFQADWTAG